LKTIAGKIKKYFAEIDWILMILAVGAAAVGLIFILSAAKSYSNTSRLILMQSFGICLGIIGMIIISRFDFEHLCELSRLIFIGGIFLLLLVLLFGTGKETGNVSWIRFKGIGLQPSEIVKLCFCITFATHLQAVKHKINHPKTLVFLIAHVGIILALVQMQGDTGSVLVFLFIAVVMLFYARLSIWYFISTGILAILSLPLIWNEILKEYQKKRILVVLYPELDPVKFGYQAIQCKTAIGSGQIWGQGLFHGTLTQYELIPAKHTDCIFAVIGEEGGFIACLLVIVLLLAIILRCFYVAYIARSDSGSLLCIGIGAMLLCQTVENIGMCLGVLPVIGITLPFFSYGGSSIVSVFWALGLVESVYRSRRDINFGISY
jgi:rod shape determining protein RodA